MSQKGNAKISGRESIRQGCIKVIWLGIVFDKLRTKDWVTKLAQLRVTLVDAVELRINNSVFASSQTTISIHLRINNYEYTVSM